MFTKEELIALLANNVGYLEQFFSERETAIVERTLSMVRNEYTVMPRFGFHQPLDYQL